MNDQGAKGRPVGRGVGTRLAHRLSDAHCRIVDSEPKRDEIAYLCSDFIRHTLPHRQCASNTFERRNGEDAITLMAPPTIGLPYGRWPRTILSFLTTQAVRTNSREIDLGPSLSGFLKSLGAHSTGGATGTIRAFKLQAVRTLAMSVTLSRLDEVRAQLQNSPVADNFEIAWAGISTDRRSVLPARVCLGERIFHRMVTSAVPLDLRAVRALQQSPMSFDLYAWLTYRAYRLPASHATLIAWEGLQAQFGAGYADQSDFKIAFRQALSRVKMVYPTIRCQMTDGHLVMHRSPPSVRHAPSRRSTKPADRPVDN